MNKPAKTPRAPGRPTAAATVQREQEAQGVALEKEAVEQISATYAFKANLQIFRAQDETMGSLLDTKA